MDRRAILASAGATLAVLFFVALALWAMVPPAPRPPDAPPDVFSAGRALAHVRQIARAPHPPGTPEHARARDYVHAQLAALGLETRMQRTLARRDDERLSIAVPVENILARRRGTRGSGPALILAAHYDSHPTGPGAGDDAAGVAALIETARALQGIALENDLLFVVTDAEEVGLVGAEGFVADADEARERRTVVLNVEARGGGGPVFLFETGAGNAGLMGEVANCVPYPVASSLMYALYKLLPNDTDLSVFKRAGFSGLNFAFVDRFGNYHTALDTPERLDARSLQHHGEYVLALARRLGDADLRALSDPKQGDAVYFDLFGRLLIRYPIALAWPLALLALALYGVALRRACPADPSFWRSFRAGIVQLVPLSAIAIGYGVGFLAGPTRQIAPNRTPPGIVWGEAGLYLLALAVSSAFWLPALRRHAPRPLVLGALGWWALFLVVTTALLPGGTYLFLWPFVAAVGMLLPEKRTFWRALLGALPALILWPGVLHGLFLLMGYGMAPVFATLAAFALAPLAPLFRTTRAVLPILCALAGVACLGFGLWPRRATPDHPRTSALFHFEDADTGEALWASTDTRLSDWNRPLLGDRPGSRPLSHFFPDVRRGTVQTAPTKPLGLSPVRVVRAGNRLQLAPSSGQREIVVWSRQRVAGASLDGKPLPLPDGRLRLRLVAPPASGLDLTLDAAPNAAIVVDGYTDGLPASVSLRPPGEIPAPVAPHTDVRIVRKTLRW